MQIADIKSGIELGQSIIKGEITTNGHPTTRTNTGSTKNDDCER